MKAATGSVAVASYDMSIILIFHTQEKYAADAAWPLCAVGMAQGFPLFANNLR